MAIAQQRVLRERRQYNQWVANETLEDYALRFTATKARGRSTFRVANTALGTVAFLVLEAVGATVTLSYGFTNAASAIVVVGVIIFMLGLPTSYYAAKYGVDIDLLTRGAGFGYIGSTITSLIYASFTFIFFALEAAIMSLALELCFGVPLVWGYLVSALVVIPLVTHGFTFLSKFQFWTQLIWLTLQLAAIAAVGLSGLLSIEDWTSFAGRHGPNDGHFDIMLFCGAASVVFALVAQNAEQVDFLRFLPRQRKGRRWAWWAAVIGAGPGWVVPGMLKMLLGSFFVVLLLQSGVLAEDATEPTQMYLFAFRQAVSVPEVAIALTGLFVVISQLKINVTNAYAGSLAWSNFFSRLTHSHPGRVVWLVFNVTLALMLMELGIYEALERTLGLYANIPVAWMGAIAADLAINKPLGLSPRHIEFKRAYLYDVNPVGVGSMLIASTAAIAVYAGLFGDAYHALAPFVALGLSISGVPLIALATGGRYYSARPRAAFDTESVQCCICEHSFEPEDMAGCPVYSGPICSLCCSLDARCHDACKEGASFPEQWQSFLAWALPFGLSRRVNGRMAKYAGLLLLFSCIAALLLGVIYVQMASSPSVDPGLVAETLRNVFFVMVIVIAIAIWPFLLAKESSRAARQETQQQTAMLFDEIDAHRRTDQELQKAKELAEARSWAKSKYVRGISHELRTPLNAMMGYAQLLESNQTLPSNLKRSVQIIRRSGSHLSSLVDGLLDISMIEAGRLQVHRDEIVLPDFLDQIVDMLSLQAREKGLAFLFEPPPNMPLIVRTDEKRLRQILINLLSNAIRCTPTGRVTFRMTYSSEVARFEVIDTGIGIRPEDIERIFRPFERIEDPLHPAKTGTGLGLTITKLLVDAMGGELTVISKPDEGSTFTVRLLLSKVADQARTRPAVQRSIAGYVGPERTVLVADDDPHHVAFVRETLTAIGLAIVTAEDGPTCLRAAETTAADAVLLDISMPGLNGWQVAERLRAHLLPHARIIMISADPLLETQRMAAAEIHDAYLIKPLHIPALLETLKTQLGLEWMYEQASPTEPPRLLLHDLDASQIPSRRHLASLRRSGEIGHVHGIFAKLDEILAEQPTAAPLVAHLRRLAEEFDLDGFDDALEALTAHEP